MRLIHTERLELEEFLGSDIPQYAILSHCWGDDELSYQDFLAGRKQDGLGYKKIIDCCRLAREQGLEWAWVDTCCIDKTSSAELSEAINSMFSWYEKSTICFAFLPERIVNTQSQPQSYQQSFSPGVQCNIVGHIDTIVSTVDTKRSITYCYKCFSGSRWFTRGWTLQELLAASKIVFLDQDFVEFGTKIMLADRIAAFTGIEPVFLVLPREFRRASVACRMSWASSRNTRRVEDIAYCLLGLFGVNMPLLYGEGAKAFLRLQQHIFEHTSDDSLFAWTSRYGGTPRGIFAAHPSEFANSRYVVPTPHMISLPPHRMTSIGIEFYFPESRLTTSSDVRNFQSYSEITVPLACRMSGVGRSRHETMVMKLESSRVGDSRLLYRISTSRHHIRPDRSIDRLSVHPALNMVLFGFDKVFISSDGDIHSTPYLQASITDAYRERRRGAYRALKLSNALCLMAPSALAVFDVLVFCDCEERSKSEHRTVFVWFFLTAGLWGTRSKLIYLLLVECLYFVLILGKILGVVVHCALTLAVVFVLSVGD